MQRAGHPHRVAVAAALHTADQARASGGRVDGGFEIPEDVVEALGRGDPMIGEAVLHEMFNYGTLTPRLIHPAVLKHLGHGDTKAGRRVIQAFIRLTRKQHMSKNRSFKGVTMTDNIPETQKRHDAERACLDRANQEMQRAAKGLKE